MSAAASSHGRKSTALSPAIGVRVTGTSKSGIAIGASVSPGGLPARITLRGGDGIGGVATSGWRGRSLSTKRAVLDELWTRKLRSMEVALEESESHRTREGGSP